MDSSDKLMAWMMAMAATLLAVIIVSLVAQNICRQQVVRDMVTSGADPMSARCALSNDEDKVCFVIAGQK